jgi:protein involved in sex pheromone biosynthesis
MKKSLLILSVATTLMISACGSDKTDSSGADTSMSNESTMDTSSMSTDTSSMSTDTTSVGAGQTTTDSSTMNP